MKRYPDLAILHFDAHADLRDGYDGEHYSHAAALRRVMDNQFLLWFLAELNISASKFLTLKLIKKRITCILAKIDAVGTLKKLLNH